LHILVAHAVTSAGMAGQGSPGVSSPGCHRWGSQVTDALELITSGSCVQGRATLRKHRATGGDQRDVAINTAAENGSARLGPG
jgi:hypothetical protein